jgi:hypothetical protein
MPRYRNLQDEELEIAFTIVKNRSLKKHELHKQVHELSQVYTRSEHSLYILCIRMYFVLHGKLPENITDVNNSWYSASKLLVQFVLSRGRAVSKEFKEVMNTEKPIVSRDQARKLMSDYYKNNKSWLPATILPKREFVLDCIQQGVTAEQAFLTALGAN